MVVEFHKESSSSKETKEPVRGVNGWSKAVEFNMQKLIRATKEALRRGR